MRRRNGWRGVKLASLYKSKVDTMQTYETSENTPVTAIQAATVAKPVAKVERPLTSEQALAQGYKPVTVKAHNGWPMRKRAVDGKAIAMQYYWPLFDYITGNRKAALYSATVGSVKFNTVAGEVAAIAKSYKGKAFALPDSVTDTGECTYSANSKLIIVDCAEPLPMVERRTPIASLKAKAKANRASHKAKK